MERLQKKQKKKFLLEIDTSSESEEQLPVNEDSESSLVLTLIDSLEILVKFATKRKILHHVGQVAEKTDSSECLLSVLKTMNNKNKFVFPDIEDKSSVL
ncbi:hypothetical protein PR048_014394, partial [Dryococelus australis]